MPPPSDAHDDYDDALSQWLDDGGRAPADTDDATPPPPVRSIDRPESHPPAGRERRTAI